MGNGLLSICSYFPKNGKARRRLQTSLNANAPGTYIYMAADPDPPTQFSISKPNYTIPIPSYTRTIHEIPLPELICMWAVGQ